MQSMKTTPFDSQTKVGGHPAHPILVVFPAALLPLALLTDLVHLSTDGRRWADFSIWLLVFGIAGGGAAAGVGWLDWFGIPGGTRAKTVGLTHAAANIAGLTLAALSVLFRYLDDNDVGFIAFALALLAVGAISAGGYLGGELIYKLGVAVDRQAFEAVEAHETASSAVRPGRIVRG